MSAKKAVTMIPATISRFTSIPINEVRKRRTAGYARVSTDHEEQLTSYDAQVDYYTKYIESREDWEFVCGYTEACDIIEPTQKARKIKGMTSWFKFYIIKSGLIPRSVKNPTLKLQSEDLPHLKVGSLKWAKQSLSVQEKAESERQ